RPAGAPGRLALVVEPPVLVGASPPARRGRTGLRRPGRPPLPRVPPHLRRGAPGGLPIPVPGPRPDPLARGARRLGPSLREEVEDDPPRSRIPFRPAPPARPHRRRPARPAGPPRLDPGA